MNAVSVGWANDIRWRKQIITYLGKQNSVFIFEYTSRWKDSWMCCERLNKKKQQEKKQLWGICRFGSSNGSILRSTSVKIEL